VEVPAAAQGADLHVVKPGETLTSIAQDYGTTRPRLARANAIDEWTSVKIGQKLKVPGGATVAAAPATTGKPVLAKTTAAKAIQTVAMKPQQPAAEQAVAKPVRPAAVVAKVEPKPLATRPVDPVKPAAKAAAAEAEDGGPADTASVSAPQKTALSEATARNAPQFRWPVKGRIIQGFGQSSDGINISVPEGTEVKAAENGVVAYAGNELKGYGNLVLIRHADGYVTAYAHARDLNVKRGDTVKRGQTIATAGQTGNVTSPQLLFELRKGATPVDPRQYLSGT
jgi:murein DD-endopeptidase MepM/ murein hydrolase activator NlpD